MVTWADVSAKATTLEAQGLLPTLIESTEVPPGAAWQGTQCECAVLLAEGDECRVRTHDGAWHAV